jgi:hypothetical protein
MKQIYGGALFTLTLNTHEDLLQSIFSLPNTPTEVQPIQALLSRYEECRNKTAGLHEFFKSILDGGPIGERAWCLQERHLSPRILHLLDGGLMATECLFCVDIVGDSRYPFVGQVQHGSLDAHRLRMCDRLVDVQVKLDRARSQESTLGHASLLSSWNDILISYTQRHLTNQTDNLIALSGTAELFQALSGFEYLSGLWREDFPDNILWVRPKTHDHSIPYRRLAPYQAPSWSWCSVEGPVEMFQNFKFGRDQIDDQTLLQLGDKFLGAGQKLKAVATLSKCHVVKDSSPAGPLLEGSFLRLECYIIHMKHRDCRRMLEFGDTPPTWPTYPQLQTYRWFRGDMSLDCVFDIPPHVDKAGLWCIILADLGSKYPRTGTTFVGLCLRSTSDYDNHTSKPLEDSAFERVGLVITHFTWATLEQYFKRATIKII